MERTWRCYWQSFKDFQPLLRLGETVATLWFLLAFVFAPLCVTAAVIASLWH